MKPRLLDLFCGAGGAARGYQEAGFYVVGVDIKPQPRYCGDEFFQADAMEFPLDGFDVIHASPPCQDYSTALRPLVKPGSHARLIEGTLDRLRGRLYVIENVPGAPIPPTLTLEGEFGLMLCGTMFGLRRLRRHRLFLSSIPIPRPPSDCAHREYALNPYNALARKRDGIESNTGWHFSRAMGIDWMKSEDEIREAIPPAYTRYIGERLMAMLEFAQ